MGTLSGIWNYAYLVSEDTNFSGTIPPAKKGTSRIDDSKNSNQIAAEEDIYYDVYFHAKTITFSADMDAVDVGRLTFNCEHVVFENIATDGVKCKNELVIQYKDGGSADFSALTNPNSISSESVISITNSNIIEPTGGFTPVFNKEPQLVDPVEGWKYITEITQVNGSEAGRTGEIFFSLFNMYYSDVDVTIEYQSENGWAAAGSVTKTIKSLDFDTVAIPFTIPGDAQELDTDKFTYTLNYGLPNPVEQKITLTCRIEKAPDVPGMVSLDSPADEAENVVLQPELSWVETAEADYYMIELAADVDFNDVVIRTISNTTSLLIDSDLSENTVYYWHVSASNGGGSGDWSATWSFRSEGQNSVDPMQLLTNTKLYPNPFSETTTLEYTLSAPAYIRINIHNALGIRIAAFDEGVKDTGSHSTVFNAANHPAGIYYYTIQTGDVSESGKMMLVR